MELLGLFFACDALRRVRSEKTLDDLFESYAQYLGSEGKKALPHFRYIFSCELSRKAPLTGSDAALARRSSTTPFPASCRELWVWDRGFMSGYAAARYLDWFLLPGRSLVQPQRETAHRQCRQQEEL